MEGVVKPVRVCECVIKCVCGEKSEREKSKSTVTDCFENKTASRKEKESATSDSDTTLFNSHNSKNMEVLFGQTKISPNDSGQRSSNMASSDKGEVGHSLPIDSSIDNGSSVENTMIKKNVETVEHELVHNTERKHIVSEHKSDSAHIEGKFSIASNNIGNNIRTEKHGGSVVVSDRERNKGLTTKAVETSSVYIFKAKQEQGKTERGKWMRRWDRVHRKYLFIYIKKKSIGGEKAAITHDKKTTILSQKSGNDTNPGYCCSFCEKTARQTCENCCFYYCYDCLVKLHPNIGPFTLHNVVPTTPSHAVGYCIEHGLGEKLFCEVCRQERCAACANSRCLTHFQNRLTDEDLDKEKHLLLDMMETASAALSSARRCRVEETASQLQLKAILRKTEIGAEFRAMRDALDVKQAQLNLELDTIVTESVEGISTNQEGEFQRLEREEAELTSTITGLVQSTDRVTLLKGSLTAQNTCASFLRQVEDLQQCLEVEQPPRATTLLDCPFSLYKEREHVMNSIDNCFAGECRVVFRQSECRVVFRQNILCDMGPHVGQMKVGAFVTSPPDLPTSTTITYTAEILQGRKQLATTQTENLNTLTLNLGISNIYKPSQRYIFRLTTTFLHHISSWEREYSRGRSTHMMILV